MFMKLWFRVQVASPLKMLFAQCKTEWHAKKHDTFVLFLYINFASSCFVYQLPISHVFK